MGTVAGRLSVRLGSLHDPGRKFGVCPKFVLFEGTLLLCLIQRDEREGRKGEPRGRIGEIE